MRNVKAHAMPDRCQEVEKVDLDATFVFARIRGLSLEDFSPGIGLANPAAISVLLTDPATQVLSF